MLADAAFRSQTRTVSLDIVAEYQLAGWKDLYKTLIPPAPDNPQTLYQLLHLRLRETVTLPRSDEPRNWYVMTLFDTETGDIVQWAGEGKTYAYLVEPDEDAINT